MYFDMNPASLVKNYLVIIKNIISELDSLKTFEPKELSVQFDKLQENFLNLTKLTNNGKGPSELRTDKLKALKKWLAAYADKEQFLQNTVPQRHKTKVVAIDSSTLDTYQKYANLALNYMTEMPIKYQEIKNRTLPILAMRKQLFKNLDSFVLKESDLMSFAAKEDIETIIEGVTHTPTKTINSIRSILRVYGKFIKAVEISQEEVLPLLDFFNNMSIEQIYTQFNKRNRLLQSLVKNLSNIKKIIERAPFQHKFAIMKEYQILLESMNEYLPTEVINHLTITNLTTTLQDELDKSPKQIKKYDPLKDLKMNWPKADELVSTKSKVTKPQEAMKDRVDRAIRHQELAETSQRPGKTLSPEDKKKYENLWKNETSASKKLTKLTKLAAYLISKYNI